MDYGDPKVVQPWGERLSNLTITFNRSGRVVWKYPSETWVELWLKAEERFKLDPTAELKTIDLIYDSKEVQLGVYKLEGDSLTVCLAACGDTTRPSELKADAKAGTILTTLKRVKVEEKDEKKDK